MPKTLNQDAAPYVHIIAEHATQRKPEHTEPCELNGSDGADAPCEPDKSDGDALAALNVPESLAVEHVDRTRIKLAGSSTLLSSAPLNPDAVSFVQPVAEQAARDAEDAAYAVRAKVTVAKCVRKMNRIERHAAQDEHDACDIDEKKRCKDELVARTELRKMT